MIERPKYIEKVSQWANRNVIKVLTGVRRCGKSTLMEMWANTLRSRGIESRNIIHINLELLENEKLLEYHVLHDEVLHRCAPSGINYVLIDEIQNVPEFQKAIDSLYIRPNIDLYVTGSNAKLLRGTLATLMSGRYVEIEVLPLSFAEFVSAKAQHPNESLSSLTRIWSEYLQNGSMPAVSEFADHPSIVHDYLQGILDTVLLKDVIARLGIKGTDKLSSVATYLFDNVGNLITPNSISKAFASSGIRIAPETVSDYLEGLCSSYIFYSASRFDLRGKRVMQRERKYYAADLGMRRISCSNNLRDEGRLLENIVYLELRRREGEVYVGQGTRGEIDFVTNGYEGRKYYQVSQSVKDQTTLERELSSLEAINDSYPKTLITLDDVGEISHNGIRQVYALDWLLE